MKLPHESVCRSVTTLGWSLVAYPTVFAFANVFEFWSLWWIFSHMLPSWVAYRFRVLHIRLTYICGLLANCFFNPHICGKYADQIRIWDRFYFHKYLSFRGNSRCGRRNVEMLQHPGLIFAIVDIISYCEWPMFNLVDFNGCQGLLTFWRAW